MGKISSPSIIKTAPPSSESQLYMRWISGEFFVDPGDFALLNSPPLDEILNFAPGFFLLPYYYFHPFYNPPGWSGGLPPGQAHDMCIKLLMTGK